MMTSYHVFITLVVLFPCVFSSTDLGTPDVQREYQVSLDDSHFRSRSRSYREFMKYVTNIDDVKLRDDGYHIQREILVLDTPEHHLKRLGFKLRFRREPDDDWEVALKYDAKSKDEALKVVSLLTPDLKWLARSEDEDEDDPTFTTKLEEDYKTPTSRKWAYTVNLKASDELTESVGDVSQFTVATLKSLFPALANALEVADDTKLVPVKHHLRESTRKIKLKLDGVKVKAIFFVAYEFGTQTIVKVEFSWKLKDYKKKQWRKSSFEFSEQLHSQILQSKWTKPKQSPTKDGL